MDADTYSLFEQHDWDDIGKQLVGYAANVARTYSWVRGSEDGLALGITAEDISQAVIEDAISGVRHYDPLKGELLPWLLAQVRSEVRNLWGKAGHHREVPATDDEDDEPSTGPEWVLRTVRRARSPDIAIAVVDAVAAEEHVHSLFDLVKGDKPLEDLVSAILN